MRLILKNRFRQLFLLSTLLFLVSGCKVFSLFPLYKTENLWYNPKLVGAWQGDDKDIWFEFSHLEGTSYRLDWNFIEEGDEGKKTLTISYKAKLLELGEKQYLDLFPLESDDRDFHFSNLLPVHSFLSVDLQKEQLILREINSKRLKTLFEQNRVRLKHELVRENGLEPNGQQSTSELYVLITATTDDLQKFMLKYASDPNAFDEELILIRKN